VLVVMMVILVALLGVTAFAIDVGYAYYAKRQLQSAADAAALAGAQDLPDVTTATATAQSYAATNTPANISGFNFTYTASCTKTAIIATGCSPTVNPNELTVAGTASTNTWFARLFGIPHFNLSAHANACSPCSATPVDVVVVIDRTGSMCSPTDRYGNCTDLDNAKAGVRTMLGILNPPYAEVGMIAFPPVQSTATDPCAAPYNSLAGNGFDGYDAPTRGYVTDQISGNYQSSQGVLDPSSGLYKHTEPGPAGSCIQAGGNTSYSEALRQAQTELTTHGRPNVPDYIVFLTDGEANIGSVYGPADPTYPQYNSDDMQPCQTAVDVADAAKAEGTTIYSIGYALGNNVKCTTGGFHNNPGNGNWNGCTIPSAGCQHFASTNKENPTMTSVATLDEIASSGNFYNQPSPGQLNTIFARIATDIASGASRLVDDGF
jgi:Flp pilus assembly protein TadG